jgi:hypothetical protein
MATPASDRLRLKGALFAPVLLLSLLAAPDLRADNARRSRACNTSF